MPFSLGMFLPNEIRYIPGFNEQWFEQQRRLLAMGLMPNMVLLEGGEELSPDRRAPVRDRRIELADKVQDALLELLRGQISVVPRAGQTPQPARAEAQRDLERMLNALSQERLLHFFGPASKAAFQRFQQLSRVRNLADSRAISVSAEEVLTDEGFEKFTNQGRSFLEAKRRANSLQSQLLDFLSDIVKDKPQDGARNRNLDREIQEQRRAIEVSCIAKSL
jgi:hypothetical protein